MECWHSSGVFLKVQSLLLFLLPVWPFALLGLWLAGLVKQVLASAGSTHEKATVFSNGFPYLSGYQIKKANR
jgi:hypothetical protein